MEQAILQMNEWGRARKPFFFIIDFDKKRPILIPLEELEDGEYFFEFPNFKHKKKSTQPIESLRKSKISKEEFNVAFEAVQKEISYGNTFLCNLTFSTPIELKNSISEIFDGTFAKYKVTHKNNWVSFTPEIFIQIEHNKIYTFPMKGTIDASIENAEQIILSDPKETAEHYTIVDLLRNDISLVSKNVQVDRFRFIDHIKTTSKNLLQVSSQISGLLNDDWHENIGTILDKLLPAGSISGAPKKKTIEIINTLEQHPNGRQFYTGVAGYYNGETLDSCVLIRYIYTHENRHYYCSGGGITSSSDANKEYQEILDKIYIPIA
jgi:para-aminobenzoate synthetase component I